MPDVGFHWEGCLPGKPECYIGLQKILPPITQNRSQQLVDPNPHQNRPGASGLSPAGVRQPPESGVLTPEGPFVSPSRAVPGGRLSVLI